MPKRVASLLALVPAALLGMSYADSGATVPVVLIAFATFAALIITSPKFRRAGIVVTARIGGVIATSLLLIAWMTSLVAYVQIPGAGGEAISLAEGQLWIFPTDAASGASSHFAAQWTHSGWIFRHLGTTWLKCGSFGYAFPGWSSAAPGTACYYAIWPALLAITMPTLVLWLLLPRELPAGCCQQCGYDLTGNMSGRCPECGSAATECAHTGT